ncbi:MAG: LysR family transcriptional regulator [Micrococcales bacterium]|nr:LysR family transcriptional regulator [Micrococcales bacterium]
MDLKDLALFVAVIDSGSITAGAHSVDLSLSAASTRISSMERDRGLELLHRGRRGVTPTAAGAVLAEHARLVLAEAERLERGMTAHGRGLRHEIRLVCNSSAVEMLTEFLAAALTRIPETTVHLREATSARSLEMVAADEAQLAVVSAPPEEPLQGRRLWADPLVVIGMPSGRGRRRQDVPLADVVAAPIIGLTDGSPLQDLVDREAFRLGVGTAYRVRLPSLAAVCAVAGTGAGVAVVPLGVARRHGIPDRAILPLAEPWARRTAWLVGRDLAPAPGATAGFVELLLRYAQEVDALP